MGQGWGIGMAICVQLLTTVLLNCLAARFRAKLQLPTCEVEVPCSLGCAEFEGLCARCSRAAAAEAQEGQLPTQAHQGQPTMQQVLK